MLIDNTLRSRGLCSEEAQEASRSETPDQRQRHEASCCLEFFGFNPLRKTHHAVATQIAICETKEELYDEQIEEIRVYSSAFSTNVAEVVQGYEEHSRNGQEEQEAWAMCKTQGR